MTRSIYDQQHPPVGVFSLLDFAYFGCDAAPWIIIGGISWGVMVAFISIIEPSWKDSVKLASSDRWRLSWSGLEGEGGRSWLHDGRWLMEGADEKVPVAVKEAVSWMYDLGELVDIAAFWFMIGYAIEEGVLASQSMIFEIAGCNKSLPMIGFYSRTQIGELFIEDAWQPCGAWLGRDQDGKPAEQGYQFVIPPNAAWQIGYQFTWTNADGSQFFPVNIRLRDSHTNEILMQHDWNPEHTDQKYSAFGFVRSQAPQATQRLLLLEAQLVGEITGLLVWAGPENRLAFEYTLPA